MTVWQKINNYSEKTFLKWNTFTFVGILIIVICGIKVTAGLDKYMDVLFWDEALYLNRGIHFFPHPPKTWGPSYSLYYKFLSFFIHDKIALYYFNFKLTTIVICIALFLLLLSCGVQRVLAFIFSIFFLSTFINMPLWPRVSHYCVIVIIAGIIISKYQRTLVAKLAVVSFALLVCAYARPELFAPFLVCAISAYILALANIKRLNKREWILMSTLTVLCAFIFYFLQTPFNNGDSGRGLRVFLQHFAWNYSHWHHLQNVFWLDFPDIIHNNFKDSSSLKGIISSNPQMFEQHLVSNILNYITQMSKIIFSFFAPIFTTELHWLCLMVGIMLFFVYFTFTKTSKFKRQRFFVFARQNLFTIFILLIFSAPSFVACIYAYPREHYLLLQVPLFLLLIALAISSIQVEIVKPVQKIIVVGVVWFFVMPVSEDFTYFDLFRKETSLCNLKTVAYIKRNIVTDDSIRMFDVEGYITNLLPENFTNYNDQYYRNRNIVLSDFIREKKIDIIYKTPSLSMLNNVQKDTAMLDLLKNPENYGFFEQKTGNFTPSLLIKKKQ
ncbi:MAG: hypothetical protein JWN78_3032 [Bacteroidota bacterium]|nr:hypothetical protein [Bacteroidota bacterium]